MMQDIVIGAITGYKYDQIKYWINSLNRSGFSGLKVLVCYNVDRETTQKILDHGCEVVSLDQDAQGNAVYNKPNFSIVVERFYHYWHILKARVFPVDLRYV